MVMLEEMGESFPRRKLQTAHNLPRLAVSSSAPHLQEARVRTVSVKMNVRHRARTVQPFSSHGAFHLDTPETSRPLDLQLPRLGGSKSLSCLVMNANHRLRDQQLKLQRVDQLAPISVSRPTTLAHPRSSAPMRAWDPGTWDLGPGTLGHPNLGHFNPEHSKPGQPLMTHPNPGHSNPSSPQAS